MAHISPMKSAIRPCYFRGTHCLRAPLLGFSARARALKSVFIGLQVSPPPLKADALGFQQKALFHRELGTQRYSAARP